jgi:cyclophilin family peptidyl-prolyl cis-trans isomerase
MRQVVTVLAFLALSTQAFAQATPSGRQANPPAGGRATAPAPRAGGAAASARPQTPKSADAGPVIVFETAKGSWEIETYPTEAPKTVAHVIALVRRNFYNGQRVHRVESGFVVQYGDPQSRDFTKEARWGTGGSGRSIGVAEISPKRTHTLGAVAMAHAGDARAADSQMYIMLAPAARLNGDYTVWGKVISGMDVVRRLAINDVIRRATVRAEAPAAK